jgi:hypothetical protein
MTKTEQFDYIIAQLKKIAEADNPHCYGALFQLIAKQTLENVASAGQSN